MSDYNYREFSFTLDAAAVAEWESNGPKPGDLAPDFELPVIHGTSVQLSALRGAPVVLEFGSYTCPIFCGHIEAMDEIARGHPEAASFVIYTREAHPGEVTPPHANAADKLAAAQRLVEEEGLHRRVLVDDVDGTSHKAYGAAWDAVYVIDSEGRVVLRQAWVHPADVVAVLDELAAGHPIERRQTVNMAPHSARPFGEGLLRGGKQALLDFYRTAPPPVQQRLRDSPNADVRQIVRGAAEHGSTET